MINDRFKFRVWDAGLRAYHKYGEYECGAFVDCRGVLHGAFVGKPTIEQSTGIKDKNGILIYEGDIVMTVSGKSGVVRWDSAGFAVSGDEIIGHCGICKSQEVIGNIHEEVE